MAAALVCCCPALTGAADGAENVCSPKGKVGDSSQSASNWSSTAVKPIVELREAESRLGLINLIAVAQFPSLVAATCNQGRVAVSTEKRGRPSKCLET